MFFSFILGVIFILIGLNGLLRKTDKTKGLKSGFSIVGVIVGIIFILISMIIIIDAGEVGVVVIFGKVQKKSLYNGLHFVPPYAEVIKYPTRIIEYSQEDKNLIEARVNNGLLVKVDCTTLYRINQEMAGEIYSKVAISMNELENKILLPYVRTTLRNVISKYSAEEVYSSKREQVAIEVYQELDRLTKDKGLIIENFLIRGIQLPETVDKAIQLKISAQEEAEAMKFKKQKAEQEAEIKIIEAKGLAEAQKIINSTLSPNYIQLEAIRVYKELVNSQNTTFVIMPTSPNAAGMPLILNASK